MTTKTVRSKKKKKKKKRERRKVIKFSLNEELKEQ